MPNRAARARGCGSLEVLRKVRDLRRHTLQALYFRGLTILWVYAKLLVLELSYVQSEYVSETW